MDIKSNYMLLVFLLSSWISQSSQGACTWPPEFISTQWHDSTGGDLTFGSSTMKGWTINLSTSVHISEWECLSVDSFISDGRILLSSSTRVLGISFYIYRCITLTKIADSSYQYYIMNAFHRDFSERMLASTEEVTGIASICVSDNEGASGSEYQMLIKAGNETAAKVDCPWVFLGTYGYTHTNASGSVTCNSSTSQWDMCTDSTQMTFNYSTCATKVAYSKSDTVWCVNNVVVNDTNYLMVYNGNDADADIDGSDIYRFTCFAITSSGDRASVSPEHCQKDQSPDQLPKNTAYESIGATLEMSSSTELCSRRPCSDVPDLERGTVTVSTMGSITSALYACNTNYTLTGSPKRTCQSDDTWSGTAPVCNCLPPPSLNNGNVTVSNGSVATYTCDDGYTLDGLSTRTCQITTATWEDFDNACVKCEVFNDIQGRTHALSSNGTVTKATFACSHGHTLKGEETALTCNRTGMWDGAPPTCVKCSTLDNTPGTSHNLSSDGATTTAHFTCALGYTIRGPKSIECTDGVWDTDQPTCVKCSTLNNALGTSHNLSSDGAITTAHYSCALGYTISGPKSIECTDGVWDNDQPTCVFCSNITDPMNGNVTLSTNGTITSADYACADNYHVIGHKQRHCSSNGTWIQTAPVCKCSNKTFGDKCSKSCGLCINGETCDSESGACPNGCTHHYIGAQCQDIASKMSSGLSGTHVGIIVAVVLVVIAAVCVVGCIYVRKRKETPFKRTDDELTSSAIVNESYGIEEAPVENAYDNVNESPAHDEKTDTSEDL